MRFLILNHNVRDRGTYHRAFPFARHFAARGHDVVFCCVHPQRLYRATRARVDVGGGRTLIHYEMPSWSGAQDRQEGRGPIDIARRAWLALTGRFDVVWAFSHKLDCVIPARIARRASGATFVSDWCDRWGGQDGLFDICAKEERFLRLPTRVQAARRRAFAQEAILEESVRRNEADGVTVISRALYERARNLGLPEERLLQTYSGADLDRITPQDKASCRRELGLPADALLLGYLANFNPDETLLLDALEGIMARVSPARFVYSGVPLHAPESDLKRRGLDGRIHYLGWAPFEQCVRMLGACDVLLLPLSARRLNVERFPHKLTDYLAAGRPIAACDAGDVGRFIKMNDAGELAPPTAEGLAGAVVRLLQRRAEWDAIGRRARQTAEEHFNWNRIGDAVLGFISRVGGLGPRRTGGTRIQ